MRDTGWKDVLIFLAKLTYRSARYYAEKVVDSVLIGIANSTAVDKELNGYWLPSCGSHTENLGVGSDVMMNVTVGQGENSWELKTYRDVRVYPPLSELSLVDLNFR